MGFGSESGIHRLCFVFARLCTQSFRLYTAASSDIIKNLERGWSPAEPCPRKSEGIKYYQSFVLRQCTFVHSFEKGLKWEGQGT